jgi:hypothetical protein
MFKGWLSVKNLVVLALLTPFFLIAQSTYFNNIRIPGDNQLDLLENDTAYVVLQQGNPQINDLHLHYFNKNGVFRKSDTIELGFFYESSKFGLVPYKGGYLKLGTLFLGADSAVIHITHLANTLDTTNTWAYSYNNALGSEALGVYFFAPNTILVVGMHFLRNNGQRMGLAIALDTNFSKKWDTIYNPNQNEPGGFALHNAAQLSDGSFIFSGIKGFYNNTSTLKNQGLLLKTDSLGREEWRLELTGPEGNNEVLLQKLSDSTVAFVTTSNQEEPWSNEYWTYLRYGIVSTTGVITLDTLIGPRVLNLRTSFFKATPDGNFITGGYAQSLNWGSYAFKFSPQGDSLWFREYFNGTDFFSDEGVLETMLFTQDGGLLFGGYFLDRNGAGAHTWLVKTDSFGCEVPGCQNIGLPEVSGGKPKVFTLYPNPAQEQVTLSWQIPPEGSTQGLAIKIVNLQGQTLQTIKDTDAKSQAHVLNLSHYPAGLYFLWVYSPLAPPQVLSLQVK